jgi:hypothetical protein
MSRGHVLDSVRQETPSSFPVGQGLSSASDFAVGAVRTDGGEDAATPHSAAQKKSDFFSCFWKSAGAGHEKWFGIGLGFRRYSMPFSAI